MTAAPQPGRNHCRRVGAAVVLGRDLDVLLAGPAALVLPLDPDVGKVHLLVEVRKVVRERPVLDLVRVPVGPAIAIRTSVPLLQETLVVALQLVVEDDPAEASAAPGNALGGALVRSIDLDVVGLASLLADGAAVLVQEVTAFLRESHNVVAPALDPRSARGPIPEMPQVRCASVADHRDRGGRPRRRPERADGREGAALRPRSSYGGRAGDLLSRSRGRSGRA
jgi:hypothetical protein